MRTLKIAESAGFCFGVRRSVDMAERLLKEGPCASLGMLIHNEDEVRRLGALEGAEINKAKEVLAYEITKIVHGEEEAKKAQEAARTVFASGGVSENMPSITYTKAQFEEGIDLISALVDTKLSSGRGDARRTIEQGGVKINDEKVADIARKLEEGDLKDGAIILRKGKKSVYKIVIEG